MLKQRLFRQAARIISAALLLALTPGLSQADGPLRDPTRPYSETQGTYASPPRFVVNAIIISPQRRVAIVNGRRVVVGDTVGGATVIAIEKKQLLLELGGKRITAGLNAGATRR